ncbi:MAG: translocation/assembly module TamB domain-containing protein [Pseudoxanthomonas suwonensis]|nr:translocation/assembly module TamB domain-containing protein [Pseudoxanthomonas suwonensis]
MPASASGWRARWQRYRRYGLDPLPGDATPEQREQRIAELARLARRRRRKIAVRSGVSTLAVLVLMAVAVYWMVSTIGGRDFLLAQIQLRLPVGTELQYDKAEGPVRGPLILHGVRFIHRSCPDRDGEPVAFPGCSTPRLTTFTAERAMLHPSLRPLLGRTLFLRALEVDNATLDLPEGEDEPFELPRWPQSLPAIKPPLDLHAEAIRVDGLRVTTAGEPTIDIQHIRGELDARDGRLSLREVLVESDRGRFTAHGDYAPADDYTTDLTVTAVFPAPAGHSRPYLGLVAKGDVTDLDVALSGRAPGAVSARLRVEGRERPAWRLLADAEALDPGLFARADAPAAANPMRIALQAHGTGGDAQLQGRFEQGALVATVQPSRLHLEQQRLQVHELLVDVFGGRVRVQGEADFSDPENAGYDVAVVARELRWGGADGTPPIAANADLRLHGVRTDWNVDGTGVLLRDGLRADVELAGSGDARAMQVQRLVASMPSGRLDASGTVGWAPATHWNLDARLAGFDPGYFLPGWDGAVTGVLATDGKVDDGGVLRADVRLADLGGQLRARALDGHGQVRIDGDQYRGDIRLAIGASRIEARGTLADTLDVDARFSPLRLDDLLPSAAGVLRGEVHLGGARNAPDIRARLDGSGLRWNDYRADSLLVRGQLPWRGSGGDLRLVGSGVQVGLAMDSVNVHARGAVTALQAQADARGELGTLHLRASASERGGQWSGVLEQALLRPSTGASWQLDGPARFATGNGGFTLDRSCFSASGGGSLCADADWPRRGIDLRGTGLPLALAHAYLPDLEDGKAWRMRGTIDVDGRVRPVGNAWSGTAQVRAGPGGLRTEGSAHEVLAWNGIELDADFTPNRIVATLDAAVAAAGGRGDGGRVSARLATGWDAHAPLDGEIQANLTELSWVELFSPDIVDPTGRIEGRITLAGSRAQPSLGGSAQLTGFRAEVPSLALVLTEGTARLDALPDGSARIDGRLRSGEGTLAINGTLGWRGGDTPLVLNVRGSNVTLSDTRDLRAIADPDVVVRVQAGQPLDIRGTVTVRRAMMDLQRLSEGVGRSPDVVVLDPVDPARAQASQMAMDLALVMGDDVRLRGFGLDGRLGGRLRVLSQPGRETRGSGSLDVEGRYTAYGQRLDITRGQLVWSNAPISQPLLDVRAEREIGDVRAGIAVTGRPAQLEATAYSNQGGSQSDALSYLTLGRPMSGLTGEEARQVSAADAALTAGGSMLASQLGAQLGLDDAGIMHSRTAGSVFGIGRQLSPRLYVGYGVSLLGTGQVLMLKYMLRRGFDVQIESGTVENRGSVNWRHERGGPKVRASSDVQVDD